MEDIQPQITKSAICEPCSYNRNTAPASFCCIECEESYCDACARTHKSQKATRNHEIVPSEEDTRNTCEACVNDGDEIKPAAGKCMDCDEVLCADCVKAHKSQRATRKHIIEETKVSTSPYVENPVYGVTLPCRPKVTCDVCKEIGLLSTGKFCLTCLVVLCPVCFDNHQLGPLTNNHKIIQLQEQSNGDVQKKILEMSINEKDKETESINKMKPGRPGQVGALKVDRIVVTWSAPDICLDQFSFQIRYKRKGHTQWEYYEEKTTYTTANVKGLKSHSTYVFQVRMVNNETEGPYSEVSDEIDTLPSAAELLIPKTVNDLDYEGPLSMHKITLTENVAARNPLLKTRKLAIGDGTQHAGKDKTILLLGASGTGKTTFVNGIVNYIFGVSFADPFRFTMADLENDEKANTKDRGKTRWITCYTICPSKGSNTDYPITVVDTPGFGDKGIEEDESIKKQLKELFSAVNEKGVLFVDAVCIFIKASEARLTVTQQYIYTTITSLFHRDIKENICLIITFSDGKTPPVLSSLREADLPSDSYYTFNTADMFSDNTQILTKMYFELNCKSFASFLTKVKSLKSKSLSRSNDVLAKREEVQKTAEALLVKVDLGLEKMENIKKEIAILEQFKNEMIANENFEYKRKKKVQVLIPLEKGSHVTNCLHCNVTCHTKCTRLDEDKAKCVVMDRKGYCTVCEDKCYWNEHKNTPFIIEWNEVEETCVYEELKSKYEKAKGKVGSHKAIVNDMKKELDDIETEMLNTMNKIAACNNVLSSMALRANPLSVSEHIDIIIENEKWARKPGFVDRINNLERLKRRTAIGQELEQFKTGMEGITKWKRDN